MSGDPLPPAFWSSRDGWVRFDRATPEQIAEYAEKNMKKSKVSRAQ
jgi:hypothetical protein